LSPILLAAACLAGEGDFNGRWNITVTGEPRNRAWWLEVTGAGTPRLAGKFVGAPGGQLDAIPEIRISREGQLEFVFQRNYRRGPAEGKSPPARGIYRARLVDSKLHGSFEIEGAPARALQWIGVRAPALNETDDGSWRAGAPVPLFSGKDTSGWQSRIPERPLQWRVRDGLLTNDSGAADIVSAARFRNFRLRVDYRVGKGSNSGIGLRGRYEVQIYEDHGKPPSLHGNGALYSRILPSVNASKPAGEWQTFEITLVGRQVTVVLNGTKIIDRAEIEGLTAMASDPNEDQPGPIVLQGDHGPVEFRSIVVTPLGK